MERLTRVGAHRRTWLDEGTSVMPEKGIGFRQRRALRFASTLETNDEAEAVDEWESEVDRTSSTYVKWVQGALNRLQRAGLSVDGVFGSYTRAAVIAFQRSQGLSADGIVGPLTEAALVARGATTPPTGTQPAPPTGAPSSGTPSGARGPVVTVNSGVLVSANAIAVLKDLLRSAGLGSATITSGRRTAADQGRVMYDLIERNGVAYAKNLYGSSGDQVIDVYAAGKARGDDANSIRAAMTSKVLALGPTNVSLHCSETQDIMDVAPSSIANADAFRRALDAALAAGKISRYIPPPTDPAFHIEIPLQNSQRELEWLTNPPPFSSHVLQQEAEESLERESGERFDHERGRSPGGRAKVVSRPGHRPGGPKRPGPSGRTPSPNGAKSPRPRPRNPWNAWFSSDDSSSGPDCGLANARVAQLGTLLADLAKAEGERSASLTEAVRLDAQALAKLVPLFVDNGCTRCHLARLGNDVESFGWPNQGPLDAVRAELRAALRSAERSARNTGECS
jgi:peptidoglycan hydrolase-like protein with peptidoglycan-binding domain